MANNTKVAILAGSTGLVGSHLLDQLLDSPYYHEVVALTRRPLDKKHPKLRVEQIDFDQPDPAKIKGDDLYCALGTTIAKAGSKEAQYKVDCHYPYLIGLQAKQNGVKQYMLVSSIGAKMNSSTFYLHLKGHLEEKMVKLGFDNFVAVRPSFLLGARQEFRLGEKIGIFFIKLFAPLIPLKYRGIHAEKVAKALISMANEQLHGNHFVESDKLHDF